ncbi:hypothetical protein MK805_06435 [Shimazuella sp. AN120528]|uniref:hypothetical protein n=1 Tax=Shimazuella soli TaxID=1892854 RepID=UPI001F116F5B|nr:hypothetical protein [Shimazuella soli]
MSIVFSPRNFSLDVYLQFPQLKSYICYERPTQTDYEQKRFDKEGFIDLPWLKQILPTQEADIYFCGPVPFMRCVKDSLEAIWVKQERIHEFFGTATLLETETVSV